MNCCLIKKVFVALAMKGMVRAQYVFTHPNLFIKENKGTIIIVSAGKNRVAKRNPKASPLPANLKFEKAYPASVPVTSFPRVIASDTIALFRSKRAKGTVLKASK
jgi:hypothetical protein